MIVPAKGRWSSLFRRTQSQRSILQLVEVLNTVDKNFDDFRFYELSARLQTVVVPLESEVRYSYLQVSALTELKDPGAIAQGVLRLSARIGNQSQLEFVRSLQRRIP